MIENEIGQKLKCLRFGNGGEHYSHEFENYCSTNGIRRQKIIQGRHGKMERLNHEQDYKGVCKEHEVICWVSLFNI